MVAREGAGNFVSGFLSTFDPQAFTRGFQRAEDRAERKRIRDADVAFRNEQFDLRKKEYEARKKRQEREDLRLEQERAANKKEKQRKRIADYYGRVEQKFDAEKFPLTLDAIRQMRSAFMGAETDLDRVKMLQPLKSLTEQDIANYEKRRIRRSQAAARITSRALSKDNRMKELRNFTKPSATSISIDRSLSERLPTKRKDITPGWFEDKVKARYRAYAGPRIQQGAKVLFFDQFARQTKNSGVGYILSGENVPLDSATRYLLRDKNGRPVSAAKFRTAAQSARNPDEAVDSFSMLNNVDASARVYLVEQAKRFMSKAR